MKKTCKNCIHHDVCKRIAYELDCHNKSTKEAEEELPIKCNSFNDKERFIELPCKVGDTVYTESWIKGQVTSFKAPDVEWIIENKALFGKELFLDPNEATEKILKSKEALTQAEKPCYNAEITISEKEEIVFDFSFKNYNGTYEETKTIARLIKDCIAHETLGDGEYTGAIVFSQVKPDGSEEYIDSDEFFFDIAGPFVTFEF